MDDAVIGMQRTKNDRKDEQRFSERRSGLDQRLRERRSRHSGGRVAESRSDRRNRLRRQVYRRSLFNRRAGPPGYVH